MNALSFFYEPTPVKQQSAVIQILIKGMACATDTMLGYGDPLIVMDSHGHA